MNVGQILETHLGAAAVDLGKKFLDLSVKSQSSKSAIMAVSYTHLRDHET